jgi:hypothetical protein
LFLVTTIVVVIVVTILKDSEDLVFSGISHNFEFYFKSNY